MAEGSPQFKPGNNIAMKVPAHEYESTVRFYRDILKLRQLSQDFEDESARFDFGGKTLWLDKVDSMSQAEIWLQILTDDLESAAQYFNEYELARRDEIEAFPDGFKAFWLANPANIIHLVSND